MKNFFNSHKKACIIIAAVVLALLLLTAIIIGVTLGKKPDGKADDNGSSSSQSSNLTIEDPTDETNTSSELLPDSDNYISPDESEADKVLSGESNQSDNSTDSAPANTSNNNKTPATNSTASGSGSTAQNSNDNNGSSVENTFSVGSSSGTATVVQLADPKTGISWDGKSPIIYTYSDGTTGTEMKLGATYEQIPGMTTTVSEMDMPDWEPEEYDPNCRHCGKLMGDGTNGTCVRWMMSDIDCPACGVHVLANTCHTCGQ